MGMPFHGGIHPKVTGAFDIEKPAEMLPAQTSCITLSSSIGVLLQSPWCRWGSRYVWGKKSQTVLRR